MRFPPCADLACCKFYLKFAVTDLSLVIVNVHVVAVPAQAPAQPTQGEPGSGVAAEQVRVAVTAFANLLALGSSLKLAGVRGGRSEIV